MTNIQDMHILRIAKGVQKQVTGVGPMLVFDDNHINLKKVITAFER